MEAATKKLEYTFEANISNFRYAKFRVVLF